MADVLVDMTALDTPSRERGIGRYVRGLCHSLVRLAPAHGLSIAGLTRVRGRNVVDPTMSYGGDPDLQITSAGYQRHKMLRQYTKLRERFIGGPSPRHHIVCNDRYVKRLKMSVLQDH